MKIQDPKKFLPRAIKTWETLMTVGRTEFEATGETSAKIHLRDYPRIPNYVLEILTGGLEELGRLMRRNFKIAFDGSDPSNHCWSVEW